MATKTSSILDLGSRSAMSIVGSAPLSTNLKQRKYWAQSKWPKKWLNSMPKSTPRCPKEVITRKTTKRKRSPRKKSLKQRRRRKKNPLLLKKKLLWRNPRRKILLQPCPKATGIWMISNASTPTMTKTSLSPISGKSLTKNFSIWRCDYKYNDELTMVFMSCNLMGGMFQRLEKLRKNAFASMALIGENNNSTISGIWVWKGHELAFELSEDWKIDYSSYEWKKLDADAPETKEMVNQYLCWVGKDAQGRAFNQGKIFK